MNKLFASLALSTLALTTLAVAAHAQPVQMVRPITVDVVPTTDATDGPTPQWACCDAQQHSGCRSCSSIQ